MSYIKLAISVIIPLVIGFIGSFFTSRSVNTWYTTINKPAFNPPNWIFGPVWTILFILMGISLYLVWSLGFGKNEWLTTGIFSVNLLLNLLWSLLFFGLRSPFLALMDIMALWVIILVNIIVFYNISKTAGILLVPYLLWVSFASILNYYIYILN